MDAVEALARGLPSEPAQVRRLFWRDRRFRAVCEDYHDAVAALDRFAACDPAKADEYRQLAAELLNEAAAMLAGEHQ